MLPRPRRLARSLFGILPPKAKKLARFLFKGLRPNSAALKPNLRRPVPVWSLLLILLLGSAIGYTGSYMISVLAGATGPQSPPDFTVGSSPVTLSLPEGYLSTVDVNLVSLNEFAGSVNLTAGLFPAAFNSSIALNPVTVSLFTGSANSKMTLSAGSNTPTGSYNLNLTGTSGKIRHSVTIFVTIAPPPSPDFSMALTASSLTITAGSSGFSTILVSSLNRFMGNVTLLATVSPSVPNGPTITISPGSVRLFVDRTQASSLVITTSTNTPTVTYTVLIVGTSGSLFHSIALSLTVQ